MLAAALASTAEGISGYWDGSAAEPATPAGDTPSPSGDWTSFDKLDALPRDAVIHHDLSRLFLSVPGENGAAIAKVASVANAERSEFSPLLTISPPTLNVFKAQLTHLRTWGDLRADRMAEILVQVYDIMPFFSGATPLHPVAKRWTLGFIDAARTVSRLVTYPIKHHFSAPRPHDLAPKLHPPIATPGHGAFPSAHAVESFLIAAILQRLATGAFPDLTANPGAQGLYRVAARIAQNRTVAGVHYPVDSTAGALLGVALGQVLVAHLDRVGTVKPWSLDARVWCDPSTVWHGDFDMDSFGALLANLAPNADGTEASGGGVTRCEIPLIIAAPAPNSMLPTIWGKVTAEWA